MIDTDGYRLNVGIILASHAGQVLWAKRRGQEAWQFPQGGLKPHEKPPQAMFRELYEEVGLTAKQVKVLGYTHRWLRYKLPSHLIRYHQRPLCIGQKQIWYLLQLTTTDDKIRLNTNLSPEFDDWHWVDYWYPLNEVVSFKRQVYENALTELEPLLPVRKTKKSTLPKVIVHSLQKNQGIQRNQSL